VCLRVDGNYPYDFTEAQGFLAHLDGRRVALCTACNAYHFHSIAPSSLARGLPLPSSFQKTHLASPPPPLYHLSLARALSAGPPTVHTPPPGRLEAANPGAPELLASHGVDLAEAAFILSSTIPYAISTGFNPQGSRNAINASLADLTEAMRAAKPPTPPRQPLAEWLKRRDAAAAHRISPVSPPPAAGSAAAAERGVGSGVVPAPLALGSPAVSPSQGGLARTPSSGPGGALARVQKDMWKCGEKIGQGAFGLVFKGMNKLNGEIIAIKELHFEPTQRKQLREMVKEVKLMNRLSHENIVTYLGGQEDIEGGKLYIFTEYVAGGSVQALLSQYGPFDEAVVRRYTPRKRAQALVAPAQRTRERATTATLVARVCCRVFFCSFC